MTGSRSLSPGITNYDSESQATGVDMMMSTSLDLSLDRSLITLDISLAPYITYLYYCGSLLISQVLPRPVVISHYFSLLDTAPSVLSLLH